jgi:flagellar biogenesis protein FliO
MSPLLLIKSLSFLALVLLLAYGCFLVMRKHFKTQSGHNQRIKVLSYKQVDQKLSVSLLEVDGQRMLVAVAPGSMAITTISAPTKTLE